MSEKSYDSELENLVTDNYITSSDRELLKSLHENDSLKLIQSYDHFSWKEGIGESRHILANKSVNYYDAKTLDNNLDIYVVDDSKLRYLSNIYIIDSKLSTSDPKPVEIIIRYLKLGVSLNDGRFIKLDKYKINDSYRYIDYPTSNSDDKITNKSIVVDFAHDELKGKIRIVYRMTFGNNKLVNSRLYIADGDLVLLDPKSNSRLERFMIAMDYWHDYKLVESDVKRTVLNRKYPDYLNAYI